MGPLFREHGRFIGPDSGACSSPHISNALVEEVYAKLTPVYDLIFGPALHAGRIAAVRRMGLRDSDRVLEIGVGTGLGVSLYPDSCQVTGIDLSAAMLAKAHARIARERLANVRLLEMDASDLLFSDDSFEVVYAPYTISAVPDPVRVAQEMRRVCRPGGRIVFLSHFLSGAPLLAAFERAAAPITLRMGFQATLDLSRLLAEAALGPAFVEKVNIPRIWSLVTCLKY